MWHLDCSERKSAETVDVAIVVFTPTLTLSGGGGRCAHLARDVSYPRLVVVALRRVACTAGHSRTHAQKEKRRVTICNTRFCEKRLQGTPEGFVRIACFEPAVATNPERTVCTLRRGGTGGGVVQPEDDDDRIGRPGFGHSLAEVVRVVALHLLHQHTAACHFPQPRPIAQMSDGVE